MDGLVIKNLSLAFQGLKILDGVNLHVKPGEVVGLIGPNGAGKTSLLNCISRIYKPQTGEICFNDIDLLRLPSHKLAQHKIARSFQDLDGHDDLTIIDKLLIGRRDATRREARDTMRMMARIREESEGKGERTDSDLLGISGYPDLLDVANEASGLLPYAVKKKADMARALAGAPRLLLLDEPAGGLVDAELPELVRLVRMAAEQLRTSILLVEHRMPVVMSLCDRVIVLDFGQKIAEGTPKEIKKNPKVIEVYLGKKSGAPSPPSLPRTHPTPSNPILEVRNLNLSYGPVKALSRISIDVPGSGITAVLGSNGAGKSSLLKAISGLEPITAGEIRFQGEPISKNHLKPRVDWIVRKGIAHVAEGRRIFKECSVVENLRLAGYTCRSSRSVSENIEKAFHYFPRLKAKCKVRDAGNLSGGEQQMLAIAQGLMMNPKLLMLDEPSLGLSPTLLDEVFEIIDQISRAERCPILIVEQNVERAMSMASYAFVLENGFLIQQGYADQIAASGDIKKLYLG